MSDSESWGATASSPRPAAAGNPYLDPGRVAFWARTVVNSCPECRHPTEHHALREIAVDRGVSSSTRSGTHTVYEVECVVCRRCCCRTYG